MTFYVIIAEFLLQLFDKEVKSFVYVLDGSVEKSKMQIPKDMKQGCKYADNIFIQFMLFQPKSRYRVHLLQTVQSMLIFQSWSCVDRQFDDTHTEFSKWKWWLEFNFVLVWNGWCFWDHLIIISLLLYLIDSYGNISTMDHLIHFMFHSRVGLLGSLDWIVLFPIRPNPKWWLQPSWKIANGDISAMGYSIHFMSGYRVWFLGSADRMALFPVGPNSVGM